MTRYTNLGRKRTHLEAGFGIDILEEEALLQGEDSDRPEKKQKRAKGKDKGSDGGDGGAPGPSRNEEGNVQDQPKNAGSSSTKKTKKPAKAAWKGMGKGPTYLLYVHD